MGSLHFWGLSMRRYALSDDQFARIEALLPGRPGSVGRNSDVGNRLFVEAVIWKFRSGAPWRDLPERFGAWKNVHTRFSRWAKKGVWESLFKALADDPDNEYAMIDATIVRAHSIAPARPKKRRGGSARAVARRIDDQDSRHRRRARQSAGDPPDRRSDPRHHPGRSAPGRSRAAGPHR